MKKPKKISWTVNDIFLVPLSDGSFSVGIILSQVPLPFKGVALGLYRDKVTSSDEVTMEMLGKGNLASVQLVIPEKLNNGSWPVVTAGLTAQLPVDIDIDNYIDIDSIVASQGIGVEFLNYVIIEDFLNAFHRLLPWNEYFDPDYFDGLLLSKTIKPKGLIYKTAI